MRPVQLGLRLLAREWRSGELGVLLLALAVAVAALSGVGLLVDRVNRAMLLQAITLQEPGRLTKVPGIGAKTAQRLLLELKGKLGADIGAPLGAASGAQSDILQALLALGYNDKEAALALKALPPDVGVSDGIKLALKALAR